MTPAGNRWLSRSAGVVTAGLVVGLLIGLVLAVPRIFEYRGSARLVTLPLLASSINVGAVAGVTAAILTAVAWWAGRGLQSQVLRSLLAVGLPWLPLSLVLGRLFNQRYLPGFFTPVSLGANVALGLVLVAILLVAARGLRRRQREAGPRSGRAVVWLVALLAVVAAVNLAEPAAMARPRKPNVIVLLVDVLRGDRLGCYGYSRRTSPNIDRFAQDAILFEQTVAQSTFTKTSVSSIFTSLFPYHHGVYIAADFQHPSAGIRADTLSPALQTLSETMQANGFLTVAWVQNPQLQANMGFAQGFTRYHDQPGKMKVIAREFAAFQRELGRRVPFYAYLHFLDLHGPYLPAPPWDTLFGRYSDRFDHIDMSNWRSYRNAVRDGTIVPTPDELRQLEALYDGQLAYVDSKIGEILDELKANGLYDDSLIIVTGDHGDGFMEHGFISHSNVPYEELIRVPLIVKLPHSAQAGRRVAQQVALVDVGKTILDFVGATGQAQTDGVSLLPLIEGGAEADRSIVSEHRDQVSVRTRRWKYIARPDGSRELYDLLADPGERVDLVAQQPEVAAELEAVVQGVAEAKKRLVETEQVVVDDETAKQLRALGYLDP